MKRLSQEIFSKAALCVWLIGIIHVILLMEFLDFAVVEFAICINIGINNKEEFE